MNPFAIIGQASSRFDDGRVFPGPSGRRLVELLGFDDYVDLWSKAHLQNLFEIEERLPRDDAGHRMDMAEARKRAQAILDAMLFINPQTQVIACGRNVFSALTGRRRIDFYKGLRIKSDYGHHVDVWCFPHPSGANDYWSDPTNVEFASKFIRKIYKRSAMLDE